MSGERLVVVGLDDSTGGRRALAWALRHAARTGSTVQVVTAAQASNIGGRALAQQRHEAAVVRQRSIVSELLAEVEDRPVVAMEVVDDHPVRALVQASAEADMLVVGSQMRGPLCGALVGSVGAGCLREARTAVTVIPATESAELHEELVPATGLASSWAGGTSDD